MGKKGIIASVLLEQDKPLATQKTRAFQVQVVQLSC